MIERDFVDERLPERAIGSAAFVGSLWTRILLGLDLGFVLDHNRPPLGRDQHSLPHHLRAQHDVRHREHPARIVRPEPDLDQPETRDQTAAKLEHLDNGVDVRADAVARDDQQEVAVRE
ncbi:MAG TPA: hypothetical protein VF331_16515 [Polyangiales bacterium]